MTMMFRATPLEFSVTGLPRRRGFGVSRGGFSDMRTRYYLLDSRPLFLQLPNTTLDIFDRAVSGPMCSGEQFLVQRFQLLHCDVDSPQSVLQTHFHRLVQARDRMPMVDLANVESLCDWALLRDAQHAGAVGTGNGNQYEISRMWSCSSRALRLHALDAICCMPYRHTRGRPSSPTPDC